MAVRNYFQLRPAFNDDASDFVLHFIDIPRPDLKAFPRVTKLGDWMAYGDTDYRFWSHISKADFTAVIAKETGIDPSHFEVVDDQDYKDYAYF
ncbi:hypothetical protein [Loigolactobacillus iwatensis]|uniref:hypothetical protein n=1 Tax=Loigolactobacillus iwatensis TaxID=1267156 RepID=UPI000F7E046F|nr:hypothetical protein [Loigolactobacillus iwatensis]